MRMIRGLAAPRAPAEPGDGELLERFAGSRDQEAFAALVRRHGPMVLAVCQSVLNHPDDAEDAFQATFLVLVRKARSIGKPKSVSSWLHGVAHRVSLKARAALSRRRAQESQVPPMPNPEADTDTLWRDLRPVLHEEVGRLPARYREPFVLCYLEGKTNEEAAAILGWPKGTVLSSLARARERLRERLTRRGLTLSAAALTTVLAEKAVPAAVAPALVDATVQIGVLYATGTVAGIAGPVLAYAAAATRSMFVAKLKLVFGVFIACSALGVGSAMLLSSRPANDPPPAATEPPAPPLPRPAVPPAPEAPPTQRVQIPDAERVLGTWVVVAGEQHGAAFKDLNDTLLVLTRADFILTAPRGELRWIIRRGETRGGWKLDPATKPGQLTLQEKTRNLQAIYRLERDRLMLCVGDPDRERPAAFATTPDDRRLLLTFQRQGPAPPAEP
jgi:RNA polymerase sigma-70 factor (ECF subfamily)